MATSQAKLKRIRHLIALAGSPEREEARTAAELACRLMREEQIDPTDVIAALPPGPGFAAGAAAPPAQTQALIPNEWLIPTLPSADANEHTRILQAQLHQREAENSWLTMRLHAAERARAAEALRRAEAEDAARHQRETARRIRETSNVLRPKKPADILGGGRKEPW